jgi:hypothetical protein
MPASCAKNVDGGVLYALVDGSVRRLGKSDPLPHGCPGIWLPKGSPAPTPRQVVDPFGSAHPNAAKAKVYTALGTPLSHDRQLEDRVSQVLSARGVGRAARSRYLDQLRPLCTSSTEPMYTALRALESGATTDAALATAHTSASTTARNTTLGMPRSAVSAKTSSAQRTYTEYISAFTEATLNFGVFTELLSRAPDDRMVIPGLITAILRSQSHGTLTAIEQRVLAILDSPVCSVKDLRGLAGVARHTEESMLALVSHPLADQSVHATAVLTLTDHKMYDSQDLPGVLRQFGGDLTRACLIVAAQADGSDPLPPPPKRPTDGELRARARKLVTRANKLLNRFNHCRPQALEVMESLTTDWSSGLDDLSDVTAQLLGSKSLQRR